jgi:hypothetical protein
MHLRATSWVALAATLLCAGSAGAQVTAVQAQVSVDDPSVKGTWLFAAPPH